MSHKQHLNELQQYRHFYYKDDTQRHHRNNQQKNPKFKKESRLESNIKHQPSTSEYSDNFKCYSDENTKLQYQNSTQTWQQINHEDDLIQNYCQQTEQQEKKMQKQKKRNFISGFNLMQSNHDSQFSTYSFENTVERRKSQVNWLCSTQIDQENILKLNRVKVENLFSPKELIHFEENQLLYEIEEIQKQKFWNCRIIESKFLIQKSVKSLKLLQLDVLLECSKCKQIVQAKTNFIKKTQSPAILINHCNQNIRIDFFHNNNQNLKNQENFIVHVACVTSSLEKIVIIRADCAVICKCENENDSMLTLDNPLQLKDGNYTILANESYRKLCRFCCKEIILQQCELMIVS